MLSYRITLGFLLAIVLSWPLTSPVEAVPQAFVSASGADFDLETIIGSDNCSPVWPCRTMRKALTAVDDGGEIVVLSSGNYEQFTVRKPVSVVAAPGVHAVITATGDSNAVTINTTGVVVLRGLTLNGFGGMIGINVVGVDVLHVEDCILNGFTGNAISFGMFGGQLYLRNTTVRNSGSDFASAVFITSGFALIDRLRMDRNRHGLVVDGGQVTIRDSVAVQQIQHAVWARGLNSPVDMAIENCTIASTGFSGFAGILAGNPSGLSRGVKMSVSNSTILDNGIGISAVQSTPSTTIVWVSNTTVAMNNKGIVQSGGAAVLSRGNNTLTGSFGDEGNFTGGFSAK